MEDTLAPGETEWRLPGEAVAMLAAPQPWAMLLGAGSAHGVGVTLTGRDLPVTVNRITDSRAFSTVSSRAVIGGDGADRFQVDSGVVALAIPATLDGAGGIDRVRGPPLTLTWSVSGPGSGSVGGVVATHDPAGPTLSIADVSVNEGNTGTKTVTLTVRLSTPSASTVTVSYGTANGTATAGTDYHSASGTLSFSPGVTSRTFTATILGDRVAEPNETLLARLSNPGPRTPTCGERRRSSPARSADRRPCG